jgi:molybdenum cofactor cytidylyltransferase
MTKTTKIISVILAAGDSKRMGKPKQLLPWGKHTLIEHAIEQHLNSKVSEIYVVLGANLEKIKNQMKDYPVKILENKTWESGLSTSIVTAAHHIKQEKVEAGGILIALADQPLLDADYLNTLLQIFNKNPNKIAATAYEKKCGVPAIFPISYLDALSELSGDKGASQLIHAEKSHMIVVNSGDKTSDIDTPEVYHQLYSMFGKADK